MLSRCSPIMKLEEMITFSSDHKSILEDFHTQLLKIVLFFFAKIQYKIFFAALSIETSNHCLIVKIRAASKQLLLEKLN